MSYGWNKGSQIQINEEIALPTFRLTEFLVRHECARTFATGMVVWIPLQADRLRGP